MRNTPHVWEDHHHWAAEMPEMRPSLGDSHGKEQNVRGSSIRTF